MNDEIVNGENPLESRTPVMAGRILKELPPMKSPFFSAVTRKIAPDHTPIINRVQRV